MAATVKVYGYYGATPSTEDLANVSDNLRFNNADTIVDNTDVTNPCVKPESGTNYSWWKTTALEAESAPTTYINNVKLYSDGSNDLGTGMGVKVATASSYVQATGDAETGTQLTMANHAGLAAEPTDLFAFTSGSPMTVPIEGGGNHTGTGRITDFVVMQMDIADTAEGGQKGPEQLTYRYDEA